MTVEQIARFEPTHEGEEALEALVGAVGLVVDAPGRRMGDEDVEIATIAQLVDEQFGGEFEDVEHHAPFGILIAGGIIVADGAFESGHEQVVFAHGAGVQVGCALGRAFFAPVAALEFDFTPVVAKDIIAGAIDYTGEVLNVVERQVATTENEVYGTDSFVDDAAV